MAVLPADSQSAGDPSRGAFEVVLELPEAGSGGVQSPDGKWLNTLDPAAQQSLLEGWNDIRLLRRSNTIAVEMNGWPAANFAVPGLGQSLHWALVSIPEHSTRLRYLRIGPQ